MIQENSSHAIQERCVENFEFCRRDHRRNEETDPKVQIARNKTGTICSQRKRTRRQLQNSRKISSVSPKICSAPKMNWEELNLSAVVSTISPPWSLLLSSQISAQNDYDQESHGKISHPAGNAQQSAFASA